MKENDNDRGYSIYIRFKLESLFVDAFVEGRCLEIAKGNEEVKLGRNTCLDLTAEFVEIATAGGGGAQ